jgi:hypothetical protein
MKFELQKYVARAYKEIGRKTWEQRNLESTKQSGRENWSLLHTYSSDNFMKTSKLPPIRFSTKCSSKLYRKNRCRGQYIHSRHRQFHSNPRFRLPRFTMRNSQKLTWQLLAFSLFVSNKRKILIVKHLSICFHKLAQFKITTTRKYGHNWRTWKSQQQGKNPRTRSIDQIIQVCDLSIDCQRRRCHAEILEHRNCRQNPRRERYNSSTTLNWSK